MIQELRAAVLAALADHGLDQPKTYFGRIVRTVGNRLSVQKINAKDNASDVNPVEVWPGVPGVSSDPADGEQVVVSLVGQAQVPIITHRGPPTTPLVVEEGITPTNPLPLRVRHDAQETIRLLSRSPAAAKVQVGEGATQPVALAPDLIAYLQALEAWAYQVDLAIAPALAAFPPPNLISYGAAVTARISAANYPVIPIPPVPTPATFTSIVATKLEAK